jgi:hypothetical protein
MAERELEKMLDLSWRFRLEGYQLHGFCLKFVSGPDMTKDVQPGSWLDRWETANGKRRFSSGPQPDVAFASKQGAEDAQTELKRAVDIITEIAEQ